MRYIPSTEEQKQEMLKQIGVSSFKELLKDIPEKIMPKGKLKIPEAIPEAELTDLILQISRKNYDFRLCKSLLGGGAYKHYIPEAEKFLLQREEFWTAYTPYQPELSQGTLQMMFEYQSYLARLTRMEVVITSIYDGASATAEAALLTLRLTKKNKIVISSAVHPHYRETVKTYTTPHNTEIIELPHKEAMVDVEKLKELISGDDVASVIVQNPNFFGGIEDIAGISELVHDNKKTLLINSIAESMSLAVLKAPGELGVDIVAGEAQSFGLSLNYGGPYNGYLATRKQYIRQIPGRISGETVDSDGKRVFVMTMRAREQDIRRQKATSNICSNHGLNSVAADIYLSLMGTEGLYKLSLLNTKAAHYLEKLLLKSGKFEKVYTYPFYNEFLLKSKSSVAALNQRLLENNFIPPLTVGQFFEGPQWENVLLFAVTELLSRDDLNRAAEILSS
jgi:glycine dehydrogenase subunit 1